MAEKKAEQAKEPKFPVATLAENAKGLSPQFGVKPEVIEAVLSSCEGELTKTELQKRIDAFLKKEAK
jgi:hypothetical protein